MIATLAIAALAIPTALAARAPSAAPTPQVETAAPAATATERRYCVEQTHSNSRLAKRECRTRTEWLKQGFDPLEQ